MGIFDLFKKKKGEKKQSSYSNPSAAANAKKNAMTKDLNEARAGGG
jgi:hypothetical protein